MSSTSLRSCLFCGGTPLTREHVFPRWLHRTIGVAGPIDVSVSGNRLRTVAELDVKLRFVCGKCNNGWLHRLEDEFRNAVSPAIHGRPMLLDVTGQRMAALWLAKTWMLSERALAHARQGGIVLNREAHRYLLENRQPPLDIQMWVGQVNSKGRVIVWTSSQVVGSPPVGLVSMLAIGNLLLQVYVPVPPRDGTPVLRLGIGPKLSRGLLPIWPIRTNTLRFPPPAVFDIDELDQHWKSSKPIEPPRSAA